MAKAMVGRLALTLAEAAAKTVGELLGDVKAEAGVHTLVCQNSRYFARPSQSQGPGTCIDCSKNASRGAGQETWRLNWLCKASGTGKQTDFYAIKGKA